MADKTGSLTDAVKSHIRDGDTVFIAGFGHAVPFALGHEILRQNIKDLTLCRAGTDILFDLMIAAGAVKKVIFGYLGNPGIGLGHAFRRAVKEGKIEYEDWTNFAMILRLHAARLGMPFLPSRILQLGDMPKALPDLKFMDCPYTGEKLACIPALKPDVAIVHAQAADRNGNIQFYGIDGDTVEGALASDKIIVSVEQLLEPEQIAQAPERTRIPAHRVSAVCEVPFGAHPSYVEGYYGRDDEHFYAYDKAGRDAETLQTYLKEWVFDCPTRDQYLETIGAKKLSALKAQSSGRMP
ncbi:MAG: CoA transferase subunit A [Rhodospirillales bacterium]